MEELKDIIFNNSQDVKLIDFKNVTPAELQIFLLGLETLNFILQKRISKNPSESNSLLVQTNQINSLIEKILKIYPTFQINWNGLLESAIYDDINSK